MRKTFPLNHNWQFTKTPYNKLSQKNTHWSTVSLPHTLNAADETDGEGEYYNGECCYKTTLNPNEFLIDTPWNSDMLPLHAFLRIPALSIRGNVYVNGRRLASHEGGYSAFTVDITEEFRKARRSGSELDIIFAFYGGLSRGVELLILPSVHFDLSFHAAKGLVVTSELPDDSENVILHLNSCVNTDSADYTIHYQIVDRYGSITAESRRPVTEPKTDILLPAPHLWQGADAPCIYRCIATLVCHNEQIDQVSSTFSIHGLYDDNLKNTEGDDDGVTNWFERIETVASDAPIEFSTSHFSVQDKVRDIMEHDDAFRILSGSLSSMSGTKLKKSMLYMMQDKTFAELADILTARGNGNAPKNALQIINSELNKISKHN